MTALIVMAGPVAAAPSAPLQLPLPAGAVTTATDGGPGQSYAVPVKPFTAGTVPSEPTEGRVSQSAWRIPNHDDTSLQMISPIRDALKKDGFSLLLDCDEATCGGFDFRFGVDIIEAPEMEVDLFDYRALTARRGTGPDAEYVFVLASRTPEDGYLQVVHVVQDGSEAATAPVKSVSLPIPAAPAAETALPQDADVSDTAPADLPAALVTQGHVVLAGLEFDTGSARLGSRDYPSLDALAAYLKADSSRRVVLVGHSDLSGTLEENITLSRKRAEQVLTRLTGALGVDPAQITARGIGYLAPRTNNLTPENREENRRVEAVLLAPGEMP